MNFWATNKVYINITPHNFYTPTLANYILLGLPSCIGHNMSKKWFVQISCLTTNFYTTNQVYVTIITQNYYTQILGNYVLFCLRSWIEHNLRKKGSIQLSYLTINFCATNQVYINITPHNFYTPILANYVLLCLRSCIEHNLRKKGFVQISCLTMNFYTTNQVCVTIITHNYYA